MYQKINKVTSTQEGNYKAGGNYNPGKTGIIIFHPANSDFLANADLATPAAKLAAVNALTVNDTYKTRAFALSNLIMPQKKGEDMTFEKRDQFTFQADNGTWEMWYTINGSYADYQKACKLLNGRGKQFRFVLGDLGDGAGKFNFRHSTTSTGVKGFKVHQITVLPLSEAIPGKAVEYQIRVAAADINEINKADHTEFGFNPYTDLNAIEDVFINQIASVTAATFKYNVSGVGGEENFAELYKGTSELKRTGAWSVVNAAGVTIPILSIAAVLTGTETTAFALALDGTDPSYVVGQKAYIKMPAPSVIFGYTGIYMESNIMEVTLT